MSFIQIEDNVVGGLAVESLVRNLRIDGSSPNGLLYQSKFIFETEIF